MACEPQQETQLWQCWTCIMLKVGCDYFTVSDMKLVREVAEHSVGFEVSEATEGVAEVSEATC